MEEGGFRGVEEVRDVQLLRVLTISQRLGRYYQTRVPRFAFGFAKFKHKIKEITCVPLPSKRTFACLPGWLAFRAVRAFQQDPTTNRAMPQRGFKRDSTLLSITT